MAQNIGFENAQENAKYVLKVGTVIAVDAEAQTMSCLTMHGRIEGIPINNFQAVNGTGFRFMPIPLYTRVLLFDQCGVIYHLGTYYNQRNDNAEFIGLKQYTNNAAYDKECAAQQVLQRHLEAGEISVSGPNLSEIFFPLNGDILIIDSHRTSIRLDSQLNSIVESATAHITETDSALCQFGHVTRRVKQDSKDFDKLYKTSKGVVAESSLEDLGPDSVNLTEFNVSIGLPKNVNTLKYDDECDSADIRCILSDLVLDNRGGIVKQDGNPLYFLMDIKPSGVRACIDQVGNIFFTSNVDYTTIAQYLKMSFGDAPSFTFKIGNTVVRLDSDESYNVISANGSISYKKDGSLSYLINDKLEMIVHADGTFSLSKYTKDDSGNVTYLYRIYSDENNKIYQECKSGITLKTIDNGDDSEQPMVMGDNLVSLFHDFMSAVANHKHPVSGSTAGPSTDLVSYTQMSADTIKQNILSKKNKSN